MYSFTLILSVDYLLRIADFFTSGQPKAEEPKVAARTNKQLSSRLKSSQVVQEKQMQMTINMKIEKPDIILVEHMDNIDTNALILNVSTYCIRGVSCRENLEMTERNI